LKEYCVTCPLAVVLAESVTTGATVYQPARPLGAAGFTVAVVTGVTVVAAGIVRVTLGDTLPATSVARKAIDFAVALVTVGLV
jgi:hypothetical protein